MKTSKPLLALAILIAAGALIVFFWPVHPPQAQSSGETDQLLRPHPLESVAAPRDHQAGTSSPAPLVAKKPTGLAALSPEDQARVKAEKEQLLAQFKEFETANATVKLDRSGKFGHIHAVQTSELSLEELNTLYDAGTAAVAKFTEGTPASDVMRNEVAALVADFSHPHLLAATTSPNGNWTFSTFSGDPATWSVTVSEDGETVNMDGGSMVLTCHQPTEDVSTSPQTQRYAHLFQH